MFNFIRRDVTTTSTQKRTQSTDDNDDEDDDLEDEEVEIRHYAIRTKPVGVDRKVRRLVESKIPNLSKINDIADYITGDAPAITKPGDMSDSEAEDETSHVVLPSNTKKSKKGKKNNTNESSQKSALKLVEIGPRLRLKLYKVERALSSGDVMYHAYVHKTPSEVAALKSRKEGEVTLKKRRREEQEANVERKRMAKEDKKVKREERRKEREEKAMAELRGESGGGGMEGRNESDDDEEESASSSGEEGEESSSEEEEGEGSSDEE